MLLVSVDTRTKGCHNVCVTFGLILVCFSRYELSARPGPCRNRSRFDQRNETWEVWRLCSIFQISIFTIFTIRDKSSELNLRDKSAQFSQSQSCTVVMHLHLNWTAPWWMWQQTDVKKTCMPWLSAMASAHLGRYQKVPPVLCYSWQDF